MTSDPSYSYAWNGENELTGFGGTSYYTYDGDHKRVENSYNGYYYWFSPGGLPLAETNSSGTTQNEYIYFNGARVARRDSSGNVYYCFSDHVGTAQMLTNSTGTLCYDSDNTPFGYVMAYTTTCPQNYQLAGMELDGGTGNYHTWFRQYEPNLGRWMSPDLLGGDVTNPQSLNRYAYVLNNPASLVDPLGLDAGDACEASAAQFGWFDCPNGSGGAGLGSGGLGGGIGIDPSLCFDDPYPDPSCGMPGGMGGGGGIWVGGGQAGGMGNADNPPNGQSGSTCTDFPGIPGSGHCTQDPTTITVSGQPFPWWPPLAATIAGLYAKGYYWNPGDQLINTHHPGKLTFRQDFRVFCSSHQLVDPVTGKLDPGSYHIDTINPVPITPFGTYAWFFTVPAHYLADVKEILPSSAACSQ